MAATANPSESKQIFISHSHEEDAKPAKQLAKDLESNGHQPWIAPDCIHPGELWVTAIQRGLSESDTFVVVMTPAAMKSHWVNFEASVGIQRAVEEAMLFIPLDFQECTVPAFWRQFQFVSFRKSYQDGLKALLARLSSKSSRTAVRSVGKKTRFSFPKQATRNSKLAVNLLNAAAATPVTVINKQAALYRVAQNIKFGEPQSDEFHFNVAGNTYVGQVFGKGIAYAKTGDWGNVNLLEKPKGL
jgi:hypothetical protein